MLSSKSFIVLPCTVKSFSHLELNFDKGVHFF